MKLLSTVFISLPLLLLNVSSEKDMDFGSFSMEIPSQWTYIKENRTDVFMGKIVIDEKDTLQFYYGKRFNFEGNKGFYIRNDSVFLFQKKEENDNHKTDQFYGKADTVNFKKLSNIKYSVKKINNLKARIATPKKAGIGLTYVYFEKTKTKEKNMTFLMSGFNLDIANQEAFLKVIRTIKFKD